MAADTGRLPPVSLLEISRVLEETARLVRMHASSPEEAPRKAPAIRLKQVRAIIAARWLRREFLGFEAADAAWSLMLELYAARLEGRGFSQTRLAVAEGRGQKPAVEDAWWRGRI